jgi:hypothetical protein
MNRISCIHGTTLISERLGSKIERRLLQVVPFIVRISCLTLIIYHRRSTIITYYSYTICILCLTPLAYHRSSYYFTKEQSSNIRLCFSLIILSQGVRLFHTLTSHITYSYTLSYSYHPGSFPAMLGLS